MPPPFSHADREAHHGLDPEALRQYNQQLAAKRRRGRRHLQQQTTLSTAIFSAKDNAAAEHTALVFKSVISASAGGAGAAREGPAHRPARLGQERRRHRPELLAAASALTAAHVLIGFFDREVTLVARELLGATLLVDGVGGRIVETEAYHPTDPASHSFRGPTPRNASMFAGPGRVYVYRSYGIHWCLNFVCGGAAAVLIRAIEPTAGLAAMIERRGLAAERALCSGPGRLTEALAVTRAHDGLMLDAPPFALAPARAGAGRRRPAHRHHQGGGQALALRHRRLPFLSRKFAEPVG